jgi:signal recognition particle subunit SRP9
MTRQCVFILLTSDVAYLSTQCIKFKTYSSIFLNRFEALNLSLIQKMQNKRPAPIAQTLGAPDNTKDADQARAASPLISQSGGPTAGGVKKKKPKKKK